MGSMLTHDLIECAENMQRLPQAPLPPRESALRQDAIRLMVRAAEEIERLKEEQKSNGDHPRRVTGTRAK